MTGVDEVEQHTRASVRLWNWLRHDRGWLAAATQFPGTAFFNISTLAALTHNASAAEENRYVWRPDLFGSTLFLVASAFGVLAVSARFLQSSDALPSVAHRVAEHGGFDPVHGLGAGGDAAPSTDELVSTRVAVAGTLIGAVCFLAGAVLMFPAWRQAIVRTHQPLRPGHP